MKVQEAISKVMEEVRQVRKDSKNVQQNFQFRGIDAVMNAVGPALRKHQLVILPEVLEHSIAGSVTSKGNQINVCRVKVRYTFYGPEGDSVSAVVPGESMDSGDKATAKAMSVAYRTALLQALTLPTDDTDPDQDAYQATHPMPTGQAAGPNWSQLFEAAAGDVRKLEALRNQGRAAGAPEAMFPAIENRIKELTTDQPLEGVVQP